jgi:hypothetical protein
VAYDNAQKVLKFAGHKYVGAVTYGEASIGLRTASSFIPEFESGLDGTRLQIGDFAQKLSDFYMQQWKNTSLPVTPDYKGDGMTFLVGGFNDGEPYGRVYVCTIPNVPKPIEQNPNLGEFGIIWGGQRDIVDRIIQGYDTRVLDIAAKALNLSQPQVQQLRQALGPLAMPVPIQFLSLQDCIDLAIFFLRTTMSAQKLTVGIRGVGGPIDIAIITKTDLFRFIQQKQLFGESSARP